MKRAASLFGVVALLSAATLTGCGKENSSPSSKDSCTIGTAVLGYVVALATKGRELEEIGEAVSSKFGGDVLSAACETAVTTFINQPQAEVHLTLEEVSGLIRTQVSLDELHKTLSNPPPEPAPGSEWVACFEYTNTFSQSLCLRKLIPPPSS